MKFRITVTEGKRKHESFIIDADSYESAAQKALPKLGIKGKNAQAVRVTGIAGKSGIYQGYKPVSKKHGSGLNSDGPNFHVTEES